MKITFDQVRARQPQLFSGVVITIPAAMMQGWRIITAIESVIAMPAYQAHALAQAPEIARLPTPARGVFMGYDFHLTDSGPKLIEINTNAGAACSTPTCWPRRAGRAGARIRDEFVAMFREEWRGAGQSPVATHCHRR
jgi:hypothetical protein